MSELLEKILSKDNMNTAYKRVCANKGAGGVDEVTIEELGEWGLQKLGIGKDLARLTAYCGDRYYWVVTKTSAMRSTLILRSAA